MNESVSGDAEIAEIVKLALLAVQDDGVPPESVQAALEAVDRLLRRIERLMAALDFISSIAHTALTQEKPREVRLFNGPWSGQRMVWGPYLRYELPLRGAYVLDLPLGISATWESAITEEEERK